MRPHSGAVAAFGSVGRKMQQELVPRPEYVDRIRPFIDTDIIKVITGIRRSGKSALLRLLQQDLLEQGVSGSQIISINLESADMMAVRRPETLLDHIMGLAGDEPRSYVFLDEVQLVDGWEQVANALRVSGRFDVFVSGSNAQVLSGELATHIAGRHVEFRVYPYSFAEYLSAYRTKEPDVAERAAFQSYIRLGGMPYLQQLRYEIGPSEQYLSDLFQSIELRDIVQRGRVRDADLLERILLYALSNIGTQFSARSLARYFKNEGRSATADTILNYLRMGAQAFLYHPVPREDVRGKEILSASSKYYVADHGIRQAVIGDNTREIQLVLENMVCIELLRRGYRVATGDNNGREIDFIATRRSEKLYVQVTYYLASPETVDREFGAFVGIPDGFPRLLVSMDELDMSRDGVRHYNIRDFLLSKEWSSSGWR